MNRKEVLKSVRKAVEAARKAADKAAEADAMVSTYWKSELRPWRISQDVRTSAGLTYSMSLMLEMLLNEDKNNAEI